MTKINFENLPSTATPLNATNLNQLQTNVENAISDAIQQNVTTGTEFATNEYIDGEQIYKKRISVGALPNATYKDVDTGLTSSGVNIIKIEGTAKATTGVQLPLPFISISSANSISVSLQSNGKIRVDTGTDRTNFTESYIDLYYTKIIV